MVDSLLPMLHGSAISDTQVAPIDRLTSLRISFQRVHHATPRIYQLSTYVALEMTGSFAQPKKTFSNSSSWYTDYSQHKIQTSKRR